MDLNFWMFLEWFGACAALSGAVMMASHKVKPVFPWLLWIFSNIFYIILFSHTKQYGMLFMNMGGFIINLFGCYQWIQHATKINKQITNLLLLLTVFFALISLYYSINFLIEPTLKNAEWIGSSFGLTAAFLLASRHKYSFLCWFIWGFSNFVLLAVTLSTRQYGIVFLQIGYMIINIYGAITWLKKFNETHAFIPIDVPSQA